MTNHRIRRLALLALLLMPAFHAKPAWAEPPRKIVIFEPEIEGDLSDQSRLPEWKARISHLSAALREDIAKGGLYTVADMAPAASSLAALESRLQIHECQACLVEVAKTLGAERILDFWVFRMSNLVLTLHLEIRDGRDGAILLKRAYGFRGDNDHAWDMAEAFLIRDLAKVPAELR